MTLAATLVFLGRNRLSVLTIAGVVAVFAYFAKANGLFFLPVPFVFLLTSRQVSGTSNDERTRQVASAACAYIAGAVCCFLLWFVFFIWPNWNQYLVEVGRLRDESKVRGIHLLINLFNFVLVGDRGMASNSRFLTQALLPVGLACLWAVHFGAAIRQKGSRRTLSDLSDLERLALIWICMILPYFVISGNGADRRYHVFLVPMTILGVELLGLRRRERLHLTLRPGPGLTIPSLMVSSIAIMLPFLLYFRGALMPLIHEWTKQVDVGTLPGLSVSAEAALATLGLSVFVVLIFPIVVQFLPQYERAGRSRG